MVDSIDYGRLMHGAMRGLIREVLSEVAEDGLPGEHHFFITFDTQHPDVDIAPWLRERYPDEMTIVMQHWFDALEVGEDGFAVTLSFGNQPERLVVPFDALRTFVDPSVEFGLRFESPEAEDDEAETPETEGTAEAEPAAEEADAPRKDADVVSLDRFRK
ncbi:SspB family protein [Rhodosalinus sp.]|uniref:SspB family protein n=1 Tax=Rhodosalinus sp. TaxID=2047741 RepID=UPI00356794B6